MSRLVLALLLAVLSAAVQAGSPVWQLQGRKVPFYIAGSIHVLRSSDYPLPLALEQAFARSEILVMEVDLSEMNQAAFQSRLQQSGSWQDGTTLQDHLAPATWQRLQSFTRERGMALDALRPLKPWLAGLSLMQVDFARVGISPDKGIDPYFYQRARDSNKPVLGLETVDEQLTALQSMERVDADELLMHFMDDIESLGQSMDGVVAAWKQGDYNLIDKRLSEDMRERQPQLYQTLLVDRNRIWLGKLETLIRSGKPVLVLVGSAHLSGPDSLIPMLEKRGYRFRQTDDGGRHERRAHH